MLLAQMNNMKRGVKIAMSDIEKLDKKIIKWKAISAVDIHGRERFVNKSTAAPPTVSTHFIPMQQEIYRLRQELADAAYILSNLLESKNVRDFYEKGNF